jgi:dTDP-4-amino-4,6-dideoxygalactose transaminase
LPIIIKRRDAIAKEIDRRLSSCEAVQPVNLRKKGIAPSIFFHTLKVDLKKINVSKIKFAKAIESEGIPINSDYRDITCEWKWIPKYVKNFKLTKNALNFRDETFNLLLNEKYNNKDIKDIINCIKKVESFYLK